MKILLVVDVAAHVGQVTPQVTAIDHDQQEPVSFSFIAHLKGYLQVIKTTLLPVRDAVIETSVLDILIHKVINVLYQLLSLRGLLLSQSQTFM